MERVVNLILEALRHALANAGEHRLYKAGKLAGLFPSRNGDGGEAAAQALRDGLLELVRTEVKGKSTAEWVRLGPRGIDFLYEHESPVMALRALRETLKTNREGVPAWLAQVHAAILAIEERFATEARHWQQRLDGLERQLEGTLRRLEESQPLLPPDLASAYPWALDAVNYLDRRASAGRAAECPLPELFVALARVHQSLSIGAFHEGLRRLHERRVVRLQAATDLARLPQPEFALADGGQVYYFVAR